MKKTIFDKRKKVDPVTGMPSNAPDAISRTIFDKRKKVDPVTGMPSSASNAISRTIFYNSNWFNKWKNDNDLAGNSYSDQENLFLYQLQNIETFKPSWNEIIRDYAQIGLDDIIKFSGNKNVCRPSWNKDDGNGDGNENGDIYRDAQNLGNNNTCLESREAQFSQFGEVISVWFTGRDSANFACVAKSKDMRPVESMNLTSESPVFSSCHLEDEKSDMVDQETLKGEQSNKRQKK